MLVLSRKLQQEIVIGDNVTVTVLSVKGNTVRLGIDAPREVRVLRGELPPKTQAYQNSSPAAKASSPTNASRTLADTLSNKSIGEVTVVYSDQVDGQSTASQRLQIIPFSKSESGVSERTAGVPATDYGVNSNRLKEIINDKSR